MSDRNDGFKTFMSFITGAAIGALLGVLFAPKPGKETREELGEYLQKIAEEAREGYDDPGKEASPGGRRKGRTDDVGGRGRKGGGESGQVS
jgi:gas vesicle protein